jgi:lipopolysaccharide export LptBFGC system permease protein LptF
MRELDKISDSLFNKIRARFDNISIGDEKAQRITDPNQARFLNFDYISENGENFGNVTISLVDENTLKIYFSSNITEALDEEQEREWHNFLRSLRKFARRNMLQFDVRDINRSNLDLKDLRQQSQADSTYDKDELAIAESKLYGYGNNRRVSFGDVGTHKLIIKHRDQIDPNRSRSDQHRCCG